MAVRRERATPLAPEERRKAIIDTVVPLLAQDGPNITTKQIAEAAGIAEGTIFRVFPDKRALFLAAAAEAINPQGGREAMAAAIAPLPDLSGKVVLMAGQMIARMEQGMLAMMALRTAFMREGPHPVDREAPTGPPKFIVDANLALLDALTDLLFAPHADELSVSPRTAALVLRSLVFGTWHPGMHDHERLTPDQIADACLCGVTRPTTKNREDR
jgi:AcrR family transcriptional regulator